MIYIQLNEKMFIVQVLFLQQASKEIGYQNEITKY